MKMMLLQPGFALVLLLVFRLGSAIEGYGGTVVDAGGMSGTLVLDDDGRGTVHLPEGYLDSHLCTAADGWDDVAVSFTAKFFTISEGKPKQEIPWACVPLSGHLKR
jgi:hypothetical protein